MDNTKYVSRTCFIHPCIRTQGNRRTPQFLLPRNLLHYFLESELHIRPYASHPFGDCPERSPLRRTRFRAPLFFRTTRPSQFLRVTKPNNLPSQSPISLPLSLRFLLSSLDLHWLIRFRDKRCDFSNVYYRCPDFSCPFYWNEPTGMKNFLKLTDNLLIRPKVIGYRRGWRGKRNSVVTWTQRWHRDFHKLKRQRHSTSPWQFPRTRVLYPLVWKGNLSNKTPRKFSPLNKEVKLRGSQILLWTIDYPRAT